MYLGFKSDGTSSLDEAISVMNRCISDLRNWMIRDRLMINDGKTELIKWKKDGRQEKVEEAFFFFIPPKNPGPIFINYIPKKGDNPFLDSS